MFKDKFTGTTLNTNIFYTVDIMCSYEYLHRRIISNFVYKLLKILHNVLYSLFFLFYYFVNNRCQSVQLIKIIQLHCIILQSTHLIDFFPKMFNLGKFIIKKEIFQIITLLLYLKKIFKKYFFFRKKNFRFELKTDFFRYGSIMRLCNKDFYSFLKRKFLFHNMHKKIHMPKLLKQQKTIKFCHTLKNKDSYDVNHKVLQFQNWIGYPVRCKLILNYFFKTCFGGAIHRLLLHFYINKKYLMSNNIQRRHLYHYI